MLSDPLAVTYDGSSKSLPRATSFKPGVAKKLGSSSYASSDGEFSVRTERFLLADGSYRTEFTLFRTNPDPDPDPMVGVQRTNGVGLVFITDALGLNTSVDIPLLRTALLAYVDSATQSRLIAGEL